jgi:hypothetical protein
MPSFSLEILLSVDGAIYRLDEGDIVEWRHSELSDLKRGRITALRPSRDRLGRHRPRSIRIAPIDIAKTRRRERWISQRAVIRVCDAAGTAKSPIKGAGEPANVPAVKGGVPL